MIKLIIICLIKCFFGTGGVNDKHSGELSVLSDESAVNVHESLLWSRKSEKTCLTSHMEVYIRQRFRSLILGICMHQMRNAHLISSLYITWKFC